MSLTIRRLRLALKLAVSVALVAWILSRAELSAVLATLSSADPRFILLAAALNPLGYLASVSRWRLLIRAQGGDARLGFLVQSFLAGVFFNNLLPSTIGGDAIRVYDTARAGVPRAAAVAVVVVDRFLGLLALALFAVAGLLLSGAGAPGFALWVTAGAVALALAAAVLFLPWRGSPRLVARLAALLPARLGALAGKVAGAALAFRGRGRVLAAAFAWSLVLQAAVVLNFWLLGRALGVEIGLARFFLVVPLALFVMMAPVSINAIGVRENVFAFLLAPFGVASAAAVGIAWLDYGLILVQALVGGAVYALGRRGVRSASEAPAAEVAGALPEVAP